MLKHNYVSNKLRDIIKYYYGVLKQNKLLYFNESLNIDNLATGCLKKLIITVFVTPANNIEKNMLNKVLELRTITIYRSIDFKI